MQESKEQQLFFMKWAIQLGEKGRVTAPPNPWVGCVIVKEGEILGEGFHVAPGKSHAEVIAIEKAGRLAKGAVAYVSLEPCAHQGRTPPCVEALIESGVRKVVIPLLDPDPNVAGKGVARLREAGVEVEVGIGKEEAERSLLPYLHHRKTKRPLCVLKTAMSIDGRTAASDGSSKWITGEEARQDVQELRARSQAILIGSTTALIDLPRLTVRDVPFENPPLRVLVDRKGRVPAVGPLFDSSLAPTLIFTKVKDKQKHWEQAGAEVIVSEQLTLDLVLEELGRRNVLQLLVEGGSQLHTAFVKENLAHRFVIYVGGCILGDQGKPLFANFPISTMEKAPRWILDAVQRFGNDVRLDFLFPHQIRKETRMGS